MYAIKTTNLTKKYKEKTAVDSLNLTVEAGELYSLLGVNGAGKSTTIKLLSCLVRPTKGDALCGGFSITKDMERVKEAISVSPQETAVAQNLTVRENLELMAKIYGCRGKEAREKACALIEDFSLEEYEKSRAKTLSGGLRRRLSIAMSLITDPQILFLDEPTLGLDVLARRELWSYIQKLKGKITIILTTHYLEEAEALSDRIGIMSQGRLKAEGTARELESLAGADNFEDAFISLAQQEVQL